MTQDNYDVVVIGGGPAGYVAAIKAAQLGMKTVCIEKRGTLGGTCLNVGCIPSKALLESSKIYEKTLHETKEHGVICNKIQLDLATMLKRKNEVVSTLCKGIEGLFKKNKVDYIIGTAKIEEIGKISITNDKDKQTISSKNIIIATGSEVTTLPGISIDEKYIVSSTGALSLEKVPEKMVVIGGGYIGLELGSVWKRLGSEVTVVEFLDKIVPAIDSEIGRNLQKSLEKQGIKFALGKKVLSAVVINNKVKLEIESVSEGKKEQLEVDVVLVAVGRKPYTSGLVSENLGLKTDTQGRIEVSDHFETNIKNVYAIGDVIKGPMLAHKAEEEAVAVAEIIAGQAGHVNYSTIPSVVYTWPEVAMVGKTEEELKSQGITYKVGKFPFAANSRARAVAETEGMVKIIACDKTDKIFGVHIIGPEAGTIIAEAVVAMEYVASSEDLARICHAHPTLNEAVREASMAITMKTINF
ncbi:Dihydrolipoyl dehydrogenase 3 [Rickettsiales bacterium Ac37b]|nr:Dihydrolipoyl dehydrogenase 3 [Rickettsiales bacterium Ac37b]